MSEYLVPALIIMAVALSIFALGWHSHGAWTDRQADKAEEASQHRHRQGDPQVTTLLALPGGGRLPIDPGPDTGSWPAVVLPELVEPWRFAGEWDTGPLPVGGRVADDATNELASVDETPSEWTRRQALAMDEFIRGMTEQSNYDQHTMRA